MSANPDIITQVGVVGAATIHKRDFSERIRRLYPQLTKFLALVKGSTLDSFGKPSYTSSGMIGKQKANRMDPEWATLIPIDVMYEATGGSATTCEVADTTFWQTGDKICNTSTGEVAIVNTLTSSTVLTVTAVTGDTWSCSEGQYVSMLASSYEEGTARYNTITSEPTVNKTYLEIFREGFSIADTAKNLPTYTNEGMKQRYMCEKMVHALRKLEGSLVFSKQSSSGTTTVTIGGTAYPLYSMKGLLSYAGTSIPMDGTFSWETFNTTMYSSMPDTINGNETLYMVCGKNIKGTMNQWANDSYMMTTEAEGVRFGKKVKKYLMAGSLEVEPMEHVLFDRGGYNNSALFFQNSDLAYRFMEGLDLKVRENAQDNAMMGETDIIEGVVGLQCHSAGANVKLFSDLL